MIVFTTGQNGSSFCPIWTARENERVSAILTQH